MDRELDQVELRGQIRAILGVQHHEERDRERVGEHTDSEQTQRRCRLPRVLYTEPDAEKLWRENEYERERYRHHRCQDPLGRCTELSETLALARCLHGCEGRQQAPE